MIDFLLIEQLFTCLKPIRPIKIDISWHSDEPIDSHCFDCSYICFRTFHAYCNRIHHVKSLLYIFADQSKKIVGFHQRVVQNRWRTVWFVRKGSNRLPEILYLSTETFHLHRSTFLLCWRFRLFRFSGVNMSFVVLTNFQMLTTMFWIFPSSLHIPDKQTMDIKHDSTGIKRLYGNMSIIVVISYIIPYMFIICTAGLYSVAQISSCFKKFSLETRICLGKFPSLFLPSPESVTVKPFQCGFSLKTKINVEPPDDLNS